MLMFYRDVEMVIRKFMFELYLKWFVHWPALFVNDRYLRHVLYAFFDDCLQIRSQAVQVPVLSNLKVVNNLDVMLWSCGHLPK